MTFVPENFFEAIYTKFTGCTALKNAVAGLYPNEVPQGTAYPYIVYYMIDDIPARWFSHTSEVIRVQFSIFHQTSTGNPLSTIMDAANKLMACFDDATLAVTNYTSVYVTRDMGRLVREEGASEQERVWHYSIDYMIRISE